MCKRKAYNLFPTKKKTKTICGKNHDESKYCAREWDENKKWRIKYKNESINDNNNGTEAGHFA